MTVLTGDSLVTLPTLLADSIDSCVSDPPYGLEFMSVAWDTFKDGRKGGERVPNTWGDHGSKEHPRNAMQAAHVRRKKSVAFEEFSYAWACEVFRVLKPGGYLAAFGGTRTYHRLTCAIEDAGFEVRDCLMWLYGSGFPKGKGCLKPGWEPIVLARKPAPAPWLNIDGCRIGTSKAIPASPRQTGNSGYGKFAPEDGTGSGFNPNIGRWPANVVLDEEAAALLDGQTGTLQSGSGTLNRHSDKFRNSYGNFAGTTEAMALYGDRGGASRFFAAFPSESRLDSSEHVCDNQTWENTDRSQATPAESDTPPRRGTTDSASGIQIPSQPDLFLPTIGSGSRPTDLSRTDSTSTTRTTTSKTTDSKTSSLSTPSPTSACTAGASCETASGGSPVASAASSSLWTPNTGTYLPRGGHSTDDVARAISAESLPINEPGATRFLYCPKASPSERREYNSHPTVKPLALMQWLVRLVTPAGGTVIDPFCGSGSTLIAARREGFDAIGIDSDPHAVEITRRRLADEAGPLFAEAIS